MKSVHRSGVMAAAAVALLIAGGRSEAAGHSHQGGQREPQQAKDEAANKTADSGSFDASAVNQDVTSSANGGTRRVVANDSSDAKQIGLIRTNLKALADGFDPAVFGVATSGQKLAPQVLLALQSAAPGKLQAHYLEIRGGGEVRYSSTDPTLVVPLQEWLHAQLPNPAAALPSAHDIAMPARQPQP